MISTLIFSIGILFCGLTDRYQWYAGHDFRRDGTYYPPGLIDKWIGNVKS